MNRKASMAISEIARNVKAAFLKWLSERTEHLFKIHQKEKTLSLVLANRGSLPLTQVQKDEFNNFINKIKEMFGITANMRKDTELMMHCKLQLQ